MIDPEIILFLLAILLGCSIGYTVAVMRYKFACGKSALHEHWRVERDMLLRDKAELTLMVVGLSETDPVKAEAARKRFYQSAYSAMLTKSAREEVER